MPDSCVVYGCSNTANPEKGISVHKIPFWGDSHPECVRRRKVWVDFVNRRRAKWKPTKNSKICSLHFRREDFARMFLNLPGQERQSSPRLLADDLGPCVYPTIQANDPEFGEKDQAPQMSERARRKVREYSCSLPDYLHFELTIISKGSTAKLYVLLFLGYQRSHARICINQQQS